MSDAVDYLHAYAVSAICKARRRLASQSAFKERSGEFICFWPRKRLSRQTSSIWTISERRAKSKNRRGFAKVSVMHLLKIRHPHQAILAGERKGLVAALSLSDSEYSIIAGIVN